MNRAVASRPNVLIFLTVFGTGGTEHMVADLVTHLDPDRFRVFACSLRGGQFGESLTARGCPVYTLSVPINGDGHRAHPIAKLQAMRARVARLEALIERHRIDILHTHHLTPLLHAFLASRRAGRRWGWVHTEQIRPDVDVEYARWIERVGRWLLRRPDIVTGASDAVGAYLLDVAGVAAERVRVIYNGVDIDRYSQPHDSAAKRRELGIPADAWVIGLVANLRPQKNHESLLRAFAKLLPVVPEAWLVLVGDWERRPMLEALAGSLNIRDRVKFLGCQEVITDGQTGLLVAPNDPPALAQALLRVRRDAGLGPRLADAARAYINAHGRLEDMVKRYADAYEHVLAGRAG